MLLSLILHLKADMEFLVQLDDFWVKKALQFIQISIDSISCHLYDFIISLSVIKLVFYLIIKQNTKDLNIFY